jgi:uncharacterized membrane protein
MGNRAPLIASLGVIAGMTALSLWAWPLIPANAHIPVHWDIHGAPNGYASKSFALSVMPVLALVLTLTFAGLSLLKADEMHRASASTGYRVGWIGAVLVMAVGHAMIVLNARGIHLDIGGTSVLMVSLLMVVLGNFLGKTRRNPLVGVRTPWTYRSDYSWEKTNRMCGRLLVAVGLTVLAVLAVAGSTVAFVVLLTGLAVATILSVAMSYYYWERDPDRANLGS